MYTFETRCIEKDIKKYDEKVHKIFFNTTADLSGLPQDEEIENSDDYLRLPRQHELGELYIMREFAYNCRDVEVSGILLTVLNRSLVDCLGYVTGSSEIKGIDSKGGHICTE